MNYNNAKCPSSVIFFKTPDILSYLNPNRNRDDLISLQESKREYSKTPSMIMNADHRRTRIKHSKYAISRN